MFAEDHDVHVNEPTFSRARYGAIVGVLASLADITSEHGEREAQQTLELLDPRWAAERWAQVRDRLGVGGRGLDRTMVHLVAGFGPIMLTDEARERGQQRLAELAAAREQHPRPPVRQVSEEELAEWATKERAVFEAAERVYGPRDDSVRIDGETYRKLLTLAIDEHASLSEKVTDLIDDAYEQREWAQRRTRLRHQARVERRAGR